jgi:chromosome segregation protein
MRVTRLELIGFKSFAERTVFDLHPGITCIVGPNGCGKSNVVDSFKWVLGEQSAKSLRGDKMMEVIFDGSQSKKPRGMAEVNMHVAGLNGDPEPSNNVHSANGGETMVTRRLYRSGDSDYLINRASCRLKDIKDVFLDTGLELKSYSIFEQDNISRIINSKPEERRFLIEEVAGVVKYKVRRAEAENKLASSRINLQRINDIIGEVKRQINSLDRQAKKAERYKRLLEELKLLELKLAKKSFLELGSALKESGEALEALKEKDAALRAELATLENEHQEKRLHAAEKGKELDTLHEQLQVLERRGAEKERLIAVSDAERESLRNDIARLGEEEKETGNRITQAEARMIELGGEEQTLLAAITSVEEALSNENEELAASKKEIEEIEGSLEDVRRELFRVTDELAGLSNELAKAELTLTSLKKKGESLEIEIEKETDSLNEKEKESTSLEERAVQLRNENSLLTKEKEGMAVELSLLKEKAEAVRARLTAKREALASVLSRADSLREILLDPATKELLGSQDLHIKTALSDAIEAQPEYERAIEAALKELAWGFVVADRPEAVKALRAIRGREIGRTAFIPLSISADEAGPLPQGVLGRASDFVRADNEYTGLVKALLSNVLIVRGLEDLQEVKGNGFTYVTLGGEIFEPISSGKGEGTLVGGQNKGLLQKKRELREMDKEIAALKEDISRAEDEVKDIALSITEKEESLARLDARSHEMEKELTVLTHSAQALAEEIERIRKKISYLRLEDEELKKELFRMEEALALRLENKGAHEDRKSAREEKIAQVQKELSQKKALFEEKRAKSVETRMSLNSLKQNLEGLKKEADSVRTLKEELALRLERAKEEKERTKIRVSEKEEEAQKLMDELREIIREADRVKEAAHEKRREHDEILENILLLEEKIKSLRQEIDSLSHSISETEVKVTELRLKLENLSSNILSLYNVELSSYEALSCKEDNLPEEGEAERAAELKQKLADMGPVSLSTIEEYEELKTRFEFLNTQREDLEKSIAELEEAIKKINTSTRKNLREAYESLNSKFGEIFVEFFGGGRAELRLTDDTNILETGIEIAAQPPGKKLQNINLLSGGEKSLTALSLLFASFLIKPTPLCVLDEADAALDEPNTVKFAQMVKKLSLTTQFIVITHNRITMEAADYIYGITMQEPGVSKVISMRFAEIENV